MAKRCEKYCPLPPIPWKHKARRPIHLGFRSLGKTKNVQLFPQKLRLNTKNIEACFRMLPELTWGSMWAETCADCWWDYPKGRSRKTSAISLSSLSEISGFKPSFQSVPRDLPPPFTSRKDFSAATKSCGSNAIPRTGCEKHLDTYKLDQQCQNRQLPKTQIQKRTNTNKSKSESFFLRRCSYKPRGRKPPSKGWRNRP